jgi:dienelactone hydrolase
MPEIAYREEEWPLDVRGEARTALARVPERMAKTPWLLINLAADRGTSLREYPYALVPDLFTAAGHVVASFDLPYHGDLVHDTFGEGLRGMAAALAAGVDLAAAIRAAGTACIDAAVVRGIVVPEHVVAAGTSRGGLSALHVMAADRRVQAAMTMAQVTRLEVLAEFAAQADNPLLRQANADTLVRDLANRPLYLAMGERDERVSTEACVDFARELVAAACGTPPILDIRPGQSHTGRFDYEPGYLAGGVFLLGVCAGQR